MDRPESTAHPPRPSPVPFFSAFGGLFFFLAVAHSPPSVLRDVLHVIVGFPPLFLIAKRKNPVSREIPMKNSFVLVAYDGEYLHGCCSFPLFFDVFARSGLSRLTTGRCLDLFPQNHGFSV